MDGLRESVLAFSHNVSGTSAKDVLDMILMTQYVGVLFPAGFRVGFSVRVSGHHASCFELPCGSHSDVAQEVNHTPHCAQRECSILQRRAVQCKIPPTSQLNARDAKYITTGITASTPIKFLFELKSNALLPVLDERIRTTRLTARVLSFAVMGVGRGLQVL